MSLIFITATNTNIGKTYATTKLIKLLSDAGYSVGVAKPIETGVKDNIPNDAKILLNCAKQYNPRLKELSPLDITAYTFELPSAPFCADINNIIDINVILEKIKELSKLCDILLIEGAGGLMVPIKKEFFMIDLIEKLNAKTILITPTNIGCINDTLLNINILIQKDIDFKWYANLHKDNREFNTITRPFYDKYFEEWHLLDNMKLENINIENIIYSSITK